jgi:CBS domain-containing protein
MLEQAGRNTIFQAALAANALDSRPPLGIFRRFVVDRDGEHRDSLDIKKRGVLPVTEIARLHALARGVAAVNTEERLETLARWRGTWPWSIRAILSMPCTACSACACSISANRYWPARLAGQLHQSAQAAAPGPEQLRDAFTIIDEAQAACARPTGPGWVDVAAALASLALEISQ